ncbi:MAG: PEP-CTERM sorting domain-containing protein [Opitutales bacterium]|nr:PEP-CTERM sorting domain-containing protein [Opitutales bacterium]
MKNSFPFITLSSMLLGLSAGVAQANTLFLVDFNSTDDTAPSQDVSGNHWNVVSDSDANNLTSASTGDPLTGVNLEWQGDSVSPSGSGDHYTGSNKSERPSWAQTSDLDDALDYRLFTSRGDAGSFRITGLDQNLVYTFELASSVIANGDALMRFNIGGENSTGGTEVDTIHENNTLTPINGRTGDPLSFSTTGYGDGGAGYEWQPNNEALEDDFDGWIIWQDVIPDEFGNIEVFWNTENTAGSTRLSLNALEVTAIPEPSTYAAIFGLGALGMILLRRKLRK